MNSESELKNIDVVFKHFQAYENDKKWTDLDDILAELEYMKDFQLIIEASLSWHRGDAGNPRCVSTHSKEECLVPLIVNAVRTILSHDEGTGPLDVRHRYILLYYLAFVASGDIIS